MKEYKGKTQQMLEKPIITYTTEELKEWGKVFAVHAETAQKACGVYADKRDQCWKEFDRRCKCEICGGYKKHTKYICKHGQVTNTE